MYKLKVIGTWAFCACVWGERAGFGEGEGALGFALILELENGSLGVLGMMEFSTEDCKCREFFFYPVTEF